MITATAASRTTTVLEIILSQVKIRTENSSEKQLLFYRLSAVKHNGMKLAQYTCKQCKLARWFLLGIKCSYDGFDLWKVNSLACLRQLNQVLQTLFCLGIVMGKKTLQGNIHLLLLVYAESTTVSKQYIECN